MYVCMYRMNDKNLDSSSRISHPSPFGISIHCPFFSFFFPLSVKERKIPHTHTHTQELESISQSLTRFWRVQHIAK